MREVVVQRAHDVRDGCRRYCWGRTETIGSQDKELDRDIIGAGRGLPLGGGCWESGADR